MVANWEGDMGLGETEIEWGRWGVGEAGDGDEWP